MKKLILIILVSSLIASVAAASDKSNSLILLNAKSQAETEEAIRRIEYFGGEVRHVFVPDVLIGYVPPQVDHQLAGVSFISDVIHEKINPASYYSVSKTNELAISAWNSLLAPTEMDSSDLSKATPLKHDARPPLSELKGEEAQSPQVLSVEEADKYTSCYMIGRVAVGIILMESIGPDENWTVEQEQITINEIVAGLEYLAYAASQNEVNITWFYEVHYRVSTTYEPIQERSVPYFVLIPPHHEFLWMDHALSYLGCSDGFDGMYQYANRLRSQYQTDWGYMVFVVMDKNDPDHKFTDGLFAYAQREGPYVVMTYNNDDWGPGNMNSVLEHETGHTFGAADEYSDQCGMFDCITPYGYLDVVNGNCEDCNFNPVSCIMRGQGEWAGFCDFSRGHIGWRDSDGDGPSDPIDPNSLRYANIPDSQHQLQPGDLVRIYTLALDFLKSISVTPDNSMCCNPSGSYVITWDGTTKVGGLVAVPQVYVATISGGESFTITCWPVQNLTSPVFSDFQFDNGTLQWRLSDCQAYVRLKIYDNGDELALYPIRDKVHWAGRDYETDLVGLVEGASYTAQFFGWLPQGNASDTTEYSFVYHCDLAAPTISSVEAIDTCLHLEWDDNNNCELGYVIQRKDDTNILWVFIDTTSSDTESYTDYEVTGSETYYYRIKAYNDFGSSDYSNTVSKKARPFPPLNLFVENFYCNRRYRPIGKLASSTDEFKNFKLVDKDCEPPYPDSVLSDVSAIYADYPIRQKPGTFAGMEVWSKRCSWYNHNVIRHESTFVNLDRHMLIHTPPDTVYCSDWTYFFKVKTIDIYGDSSICWPPGELDEIPTWVWPYACCVGPCHIHLGGYPTVLKSETPRRFSLEQNHPNPFNPETQIRYALPHDSEVKLFIYNVLGQKVRTLIDEHQTAGRRAIIWDGRDDAGDEVASGIYFYRLRADDYNEIRKMVVLK